MSECVTENEHRNCLLCGDLHPYSFGLRFTPKEDGGVRGTFQSYDELQGYNGILHGGVIASLLDAAMTNCLFQQGVQAMTADLKIRYKHSVPCNAKLDLHARVVASRAPLYCLKAELILDGCTMACGEAKFMRKRRPNQGTACSPGKILTRTPPHRHRALRATNTDKKAIYTKPAKIPFGQGLKAFLNPIKGNKSHQMPSQGEKYA